MFDLASILPALATITRRPTETLSPTTVRAHLTPYRYAEFTLEPDGWVSVWAVGSMLVCGRKITTAVLTSHIHEAPKAASALRGAGARLAEVMGSAPVTANKLGEGVWSDGTNSTRDYLGAQVLGRVLLYSAPTIDQNMAVERCVSFMVRNNIALATKDTATKKAGKSKAVGAAAASA